jgi:hypothetical protein
MKEEDGDIERNVCLQKARYYSERMNENNARRHMRKTCPKRRLAMSYVDRYVHDGAVHVVTELGPSRNPSREGR